MSNTQIEIGTDSQNKQLNTFHTPSFGDEEFVDVPLLNQMQQQHHYPMEPHRQYQQDDTQTMDYPYTLWNPDSQQLYTNSNDYDLQTNNQMYYPDPMSISNNQPIQSQHNNVMMPPPQKSPQITSPMSFVGQSPHAYGENGTTSDDSDDSLVRGANNLKRPSPEPLSEKLSPTSKSAKVSAVKKPKVSRKRKKKDPNEPQKPVSAYALFFRDTQAAIKGQNPNASFGEVSTIVASMWDVLAPEHKDVYKKKTEAAKAIYLKTLAAYRASVVSKGTDLESPPPPQSQPIQSSPHSQMNNSVSKPHATSPQQISQGLPIQHSNQSQYMAAQPPQPQQQMQPQQQQPHPQHQPQQQQPQQQMHNNYVPVQYSQQYKSPTQDYMQQQQQQPMHQINNSNINQNHLGYGGYDHNHQQQQQQQHHHHQHQQHHQQQQPIEMHNGLMDNNGYHMQQSMQNSHQQHTNSHQQHTTSHHIAAGADQMGATGIAPSPNNAYHHQSNMLQKCIRTGCTNQAITSPDWEDEYCSNECVINHCGDVFGNWIQKNGQQQQQQQTYSAVK